MNPFIKLIRFHVNMLTMSFWSAVGAIGGALISGAVSKSNAKDNRDFQAEQSATAYQRAMKDMKRAGLNPILAGRLGGASTPMGSLAQTPDFASALTSGLSTGADVAKKEEETRLISEQVNHEIEKTSLTTEQKNQLQPQAELWVAQAAQATESANLANAQQHNVRAQENLTRAKTVGQNQENAINQVWTEFVKGHHNIEIARRLGLSPGEVLKMFSGIFHGIFGFVPKTISETVTKTPKGTIRSTTTRGPR